MRINIAIPTYEGLTVDFTSQIIELKNNLNRNGHTVSVSVQRGLSYIQMARNRLLDNFYESGCDRVLFVDDDVYFDVKQVISLLMVDEHVVLGVYRRKVHPESYPITLESGEKHQNGCYSVIEGPAGMLSISRSAVALLRGYAQPYKTQTESGYDYFPQGVVNGRWHGEDYAFCHLWRSTGHKIYLYPDMFMMHKCRSTGEEFNGNFLQYIKGINLDPQSCYGIMPPASPE